MKVPLSDWVGRLVGGKQVGGVRFVRCLDIWTIRAEVEERKEVMRGVADAYMSTISGSLAKVARGLVLMEPLVIEEDMPFDVIVLQHLNQSGSGLGGGPWETPWGLNRG